MPTRSWRENRQYSKSRKLYLKKAGCVFCKIDEHNKEFVNETKSFKIIIAKYDYSLWDDQNVEDHLMIVPKRHTDTLSDLSPKEAQEFVQLMSSYEKKGYNVWARAPQSSIKSVMHQHTHLIKPGKKTMKILFYIRKPYFRLYR